jgi:hypothetical protein
MFALSAADMGYDVTPDPSAERLSDKKAVEEE